MEAKTRVNDLTAEKARLSSRYLPGHPDIIKVDGQIESARAALVAQRTRVIESARNEYEAAVIEERSYAGQLESQKGAAMDLDRKAGGYLVLQRQAETNRLVYQSLLQQQKELRVVSNSRTNNVQVMDRAEPPGAPFSPNARARLVHRDHGGHARRPRPRLRHRVSRRHGEDARRCDGAAAAAAARPGARRCATNACRSSPRPCRTTSARRSDRSGRRSSSRAARRVRASSPSRAASRSRARPRPPATSAMVLALGGSRVLLIDADMRRPGLHTVDRRAERDRPVASARRPGARARRGAEDDRAEPVRHHRRAASRPTRRSCSSSERMNALLANLRSGPFDWVIIDTPPVLAVTDAVIVARAVSGVVFVIGSEMTRRVHAERAIETLSRPAERSRSARCSTASTSTATGTTTRATTAITTRTTTAPAARNPPDVSGDRRRTPLLYLLIALLVWPLVAFGGRSAATAVAFGISCLVLVAFVRGRSSTQDLSSTAGWSGRCWRS